MNINELAQAITRIEHGKKQVSIAQVKEILRVINEATDKNFYNWLKANWIR